jgi:hypothetical protein
MICAHAGSAVVTTSNTRVSVGGRAVLLSSDVLAVAGCTFRLAESPRPCVRVDWITSAVRVKVGGVPVVLFDSVGMCRDNRGSQQPPVTITSVQTRVRGI